MTILASSGIWQWDWVSFWPGLVGTLVGVVIGGFSSVYFLIWQERREKSHRRASQRQSIHDSLLSIESEFVTVQMAIDDLSLRLDRYVSGSDAQPTLAELVSAELTLDGWLNYSDSIERFAEQEAGWYGVNESRRFFSLAGRVKRLHDLLIDAVAEGRDCKKICRSILILCPIVEEASGGCNDELVDLMGITNGGADQ